MEDLKYFLEAASRREQERAIQGRQGNGIPQMSIEDLVNWWKKLQEERLRRNQTQETGVPSTPFGRMGQ